MTKDIESKPKLSIVIPSFNDASELEKALESITSLHQQAIEIIVQDGALSNQTAQVCARFSSKIRLIYSAEHDLGIYDAITKAVEKASADWILVLGSDDRVLPSLVDCLALITQKNTIYYGSVQFKYSGKMYNGAFSTEKLYLRNICQQAIIYPKSVLAQINTFSASPLFADYLLNISFWCNPTYSWQYVDKTIVEFNERGLSGKKRDDYFYKNHSKLKQVLLQKEDFSFLKVLFLKSLNHLNMWFNSIARKRV